MSEDDVNIVKHLEMIQAIISRQAGNSFLLKGWTVTLTAGLLALGVNEADTKFIALALIPSLAFWGLDAYYLRNERCFRGLYNEVRCDLGAPITQRYVAPFHMVPVDNTFAAWVKALASPSVWGVHGVVSAAILAILIVVSW